MLAEDLMKRVLYTVPPDQVILVVWKVSSLADMKTSSLDSTMLILVSSPTLLWKHQIY
jgi:hypothetical protein